MELKELLHKHDLPQTGKKDDLVKRLLENNVAPEAGEEELVSRISSNVSIVVLMATGGSGNQWSRDRDCPRGQYISTGKLNVIPDPMTS